MRHYWNTSDYPNLPIRAFRKALGKNRPATLEGGGGKGGGSSPAAPDPYVTAAATTQANKDIGAYNKALNLNNYNNPFGGQTSSIAGFDPQTGAPIYQTTVSANPGLQDAMNRALGQIGQNSNFGPNQLASMYSTIGGQSQGIFSRYGDLSSQLNQQSAQNAQQQGQNSAYAAQTQYLDPRFSQEQESLEAKLSAQGLSPSSQAYNNAMLNFQNEKQRAYSDAANQAVMTGSQLGTQNWQNQLAGLQAQGGLLQGQLSALGSDANSLAQRSALSQIPYSNLQSIAQLIPGYSGPATSSVNPADIGSYINNAYQGQLGQYNAGQQGRNQFTSGLMGAAGTLGAAYLMSDARAKRDIRRIGEWNGTPVYSYRYVFESKRRIGVMAQEAPSNAVHSFAGLLMVDYRSL